MLKKLLSPKRLLSEIQKFENMAGPSVRMPTRGGTGTRISNPDSVNPGGNFKATFDITIRRLTNNIDDVLPVGILGFAQSESGYFGLIDLPAGITYTYEGGTSVGLPDRYRYTFTKGVDTDIIEITCPQIPYPSFLQNSAVDRYRINNIRYVISDGLVQAQFAQVLDFKDSAIFGVKTSNPLTPNNFINPMDEKNNIVDIPVSMGFDKEKCIITGISQDSTAPFQVTMSFFVEFYDKMTANSIGL